MQIIIDEYYELIRDLIDIIGQVHAFGLHRKAFKKKLIDYIGIYDSVSVLFQSTFNYRLFDFVFSLY